MNGMAFRQRGVSLIEVLVAIVVLSIGLLGVAAMQTRSLGMNHSAYMRSQATAMAYDIADRMRANRAAALSGDYDHALHAAPPRGGGGATDLAEWLADLEATLPEGRGAVSRSGERIVVTVAWRDRDGELQAFVTVTEP